MRKSLLATFVLTLFISCQNQEESSYDLVLTNGKIWTGEESMPWVKWVAVKGNEIAGMGDTQAPEATKMIDLRGRLMLPGFNDSHVHFASAGSLLLGINLLDVNSDSLFRQRVIEATERLPKGSWITRGDWGAYEAWAVGSSGGGEQKRPYEPYRALIDDVTAEYPVLVTRYDRLVGMANQAALDYLGIESKTGILRGTKLEEARAAIPEKSFERRLKETQRGLEECRKWGVTTVQDMSPLDQVDVYRQLAKNGELTTRINFCPSLLDHYPTMIEQGWTINWDDPENPKPLADSLYGNMLTFGTIKTHIDGIMGARTARFYEPYSDNTVERTSWRGGWRQFSEDMQSFKNMIIQADKGDVQLRIHAIGDEANAILLDILDTLKEVNGEKERRFRLVHAQVIAPQDFVRFNDHKVVAEVQPYHVTDDMRWMEERIGYERCKGAYAFKTLQESGSVLSFGSDWPGTNASYYPINPLYGLYAAVTRQTINGEPEDGWFPEQKISLEDALKAYTWGASFGAFEEKIKGTIATGKLADFAVLDTDLFETEPSAWLEANVDYTIVDGEVVYQRENID